MSSFPNLAVSGKRARHLRVFWGMWAADTFVYPLIGPWFGRDTSLWLVSPLTRLAPSLALVTAAGTLMLAWLVGERYTHEELPSASPADAWMTLVTGVTTIGVI